MVNDFVKTIPKAYAKNSLVKGAQRMCMTSFMNDPN